jgi:hypothetical protein
MWYIIFRKDIMQLHYTRRRIWENTKSPNVNTKRLRHLLERVRQIKFIVLLQQNHRTNQVDEGLKATDQFIIPGCHPPEML